MKKIIVSILFVFSYAVVSAQKSEFLEFKVGSGKSRVSLIEFKSQKVCRIESSKDSIHQIKSAIVYFKYLDSLHTRFPKQEHDGQNFILYSKTITSNSLTDLKPELELLQPGDAIIFDEIIVISKSGTVKKVPGRTITVF
jgi:hypothetical protein